MRLPDIASMLKRIPYDGNTTRASNLSDLEASVARQQAEFQKLSDRLTQIDENAKRANEAYHKM